MAIMLAPTASSILVIAAHPDDIEIGKMGPVPLGEAFTRLSSLDG